METLPSLEDMSYDQIKVYKSQVDQIYQKKLQKRRDIVKSKIEKSAFRVIPGSYTQASPTICFSIESSEYKFERIKRKDGVSFHYSLHITVMISDVQELADFFSRKRYIIGVGDHRFCTSASIGSSLLEELLLKKDKIEAFEFVVKKILKMEIV